MSIFGRRDTGPRTADDRERARREREAARAAREGRPAPAYDDAPVVEEPAAVPEMDWTPQPVAEAVEGEHHEPVLEERVVEEPVAEAPAAQDLDWDPYAAEWDQPAPLDVAHDAPPVADEAAADERPHWDRTDAWDVPPPAEEPRAAAEPAPTLGEELTAVDRGETPDWFDDGAAAPDDGGGETVEWDVLADRPKQRPEPPSGPAGVDQPTVEWDVLKHTPREPPAAVHGHQNGAPHGKNGARPAGPAPAPAVARGRADTAGDGPQAAADAAPGTDLAGPDRVERAGRATPVTRRAQAGGRFGDEHTRPAPARRAARGRTLPPPPPGPGERRRRGGGGGGRPRLAPVLAVIGLVLIAIVLYFANAVFQPLAGEGGKDVSLTIPANSSVGDVGKLLEAKGVVDSGSFFTLRARLDGGGLQAGDYTLKQDMPYGDAIAALKQGPKAAETVKVAIPEGRARSETVPLVVDAGLKGSYLKATQKADGFSVRKYGAPKRTKTLEGFLFPATYELEAGATSADLVDKQLAAFRSTIAKVSMKRARARNLSTYDVLTIASMIDREASVPKERRLVAAVIYNRLKQGMPLGIDATIRYATRNWSSPLKQSELNINSPYNTRRRTGLPPTPIGSPGLASIKAAANPANVDYLYYVVKPCGKGAHAFSSTDAKFQRDVQAYNRKRAELGGKSPVTC